MSDIKATLAERIRTARTEAGLTQVELAKKLGRSARTIAAYENSENVPAATEIAQLGNVLGLPVGYFYGDNEDQKYRSLISALDPELRQPIYDLLEEQYNKQLSEYEWLRQSTILHDLAHMFGPSFQIEAFRRNDRKDRKRYDFVINVNDISIGIDFDKNSMTADLTIGAHEVVSFLAAFARGWKDQTQNGEPHEVENANEE